LHSHLNFNGPIFVDSGGFYFQKEGVKVTPEEIYYLQKRAGADLAVILDFPISPNYSRRKVEERLRKNVINVKKIYNIASDTSYLIPVIHGYDEYSLRKCVNKYPKK